MDREHAGVISSHYDHTLSKPELVQISAVIGDWKRNLCDPIFCSYSRVGLQTLALPNTFHHTQPVSIGSS